MNSVLDAGQSASDTGLVGPSSVAKVSLVEEADDLTLSPLGIQVDVLMIDMADSVLPSLREFDPVTDSDANIWGFSLDFPHAMPDVVALLE